MRASTQAGKSDAPMTDAYSSTRPMWVKASKGQGLRGLYRTLGTSPIRPSAQLRTRNGYHAKLSGFQRHHVAPRIAARTFGWPGPSTNTDVLAYSR